MEKLLQNTEQLCGKNKPSIHTITRPLPEVLGSLIRVLEQEGDNTSDLKELATKLTDRFNVTVTEDDLYLYFTPKICEEEANLQYTLYGFNKTEKC